MQTRAFIIHNLPQFLLTFCGDCLYRRIKTVPALQEQNIYNGRLRPITSVFKWIRKNRPTRTRAGKWELERKRRQHHKITDTKLDIYFSAFSMQNQRERERNQTSLKRLTLALALAFSYALVCSDNDKSSVFDFRLRWCVSRKNGR